MRVLVVDDEKQSREGILQHVRWGRWEVEEIRTANDGQDALEIADSFRPDIAICDIRMPRMDGIRFAQHLFERHPDCRVIFLSGYADKEYLFSAIRLHAVAYVEKPFEIAELERAIDEAAGQVRSRRESATKGERWDVQDLRMALSLEMADFGKRLKGDWVQRLKQAALDPEGAKFTAMILSFRLPEEAAGLSVVQREQTMSALCSRFNGPSHNYLLCAREGNDVVVHLLTKHQDVASLAPLLLGTAEQLAGPSCRVFAGVGDTFFSINDAPLSCQGARRALERTFFTGGQLLYARQIGKLLPYEPNEGMINTVADAARMGDETTALKGLAALAQELGSYDLKPRTALDMALNLVSKLPDADPARDAAAVRACQYLSEAMNYAEIRIRETIDRKTLYSGDNRTVREVLALIHEEYVNPRLSIAGIAHKVYLTPNYLSSVFKKETGQTINACITQRRVEVAEHMLHDPSLHLYEIAVRCGFGSVENFTRIFKKSRGVLPSVMRKTM